MGFITWKLEEEGDSSSGKLIQWFCGELFWFWHIYIPWKENSETSNKSVSWINKTPEIVEPIFQCNLILIFSLSNNPFHVCIGEIQGFSWWSHTLTRNPKMSLVMWKQHLKLYIITKAAEERQKDWRRNSCKRTGIHQKA
jgi:hypothetical protein